jgi:hypothetical protein
MLRLSKRGKKTLCDPQKHAEQMRTLRMVMQNINETTPGGIKREQFIHRKYPVKTLFASLPFIIFILLTAIVALR